MPQRRAAVRNPAYASAIAQAAMPEGALADAFEDSFAGRDTQLDRTSYRILERGALRAEGAPDGAAGTTATAKVDPGDAVVYAGPLGEVGATEARADDFTCVVR